jgi:RNA-directed DNA polymerase
MMHGHEKSDSPIGPAKLPNKAANGAAEAVEERGLAKGKTLERNRFRTQSRQHLTSALERIRQGANKGVSKRCYHSHFLLRLGVMT